MQTSPSVLLLMLAIWASQLQAQTFGPGTISTPGRAHLRHGENKITYSFDSLAAGLRWVDGSYLLFVEPRLIGNLDGVSVRVADVCREVVGTPFGPKARFLV